MLSVSESRLGRGAKIPNLVPEVDRTFVSPRADITQFNPPIALGVEDTIVSPIAMTPGQASSPEFVHLDSKPAQPAASPLQTRDGHSRGLPWMPSSHVDLGTPAQAIPAGLRRRPEPGKLPKAEGGSGGRIPPIKIYGGYGDSNDGVPGSNEPVNPADDVPEEKVIHRKELPPAVTKIIGEFAPKIEKVRDLLAECEAVCSPIDLSEIPHPEMVNDEAVEAIIAVGASFQDAPLRKRNLLPQTVDIRENGRILAANNASGVRYINDRIKLATMRTNGFMQETEVLAEHDGFVAPGEERMDLPAFLHEVGIARGTVRSLYELLPTHPMLADLSEALFAESSAYYLDLIRTGIVQAPTDADSEELYARIGEQQQQRQVGNTLEKMTALQNAALVHAVNDPDFMQAHEDRPIPSLRQQHTYLADIAPELIEDIRDQINVSWGNMIGAVNYRAHEPVNQQVIQLIDAHSALADYLRTETQTPSQSNVETVKSAAVVEKFLSDHARRLIAQAAALGVTITPDQADVLKAIKATLLAAPVRRIERLERRPHTQASPQADLSPETKFEAMTARRVISGKSGKNESARQLITSLRDLDHDASFHANARRHMPDIKPSEELLGPINRGLLAALAAGTLDLTHMTDIKAMEAVFQRFSTQGDDQTLALRREEPDQHRVLADSMGKLDFPATVQRLQKLMQYETIRTAVINTLAGAGAEENVRRDILARITGGVSQIHDYLGYSPEDRIRYELGQLPFQLDRPATPSDEEVALETISPAEARLNEASSVIADQLGWTVFEGDEGGEEGLEIHPDTPFAQVKQRIYERMSDREKRTPVTRFSWMRIEAVIETIKDPRFNGKLFLSKKPLFDGSYVVALITYQGRRFAWAEHPIIGNASYLMSSDISWQDATQGPKARARGPQFRAKQVVHGKEEGHKGKILDKLQEMWENL